MLSIVDPSTRRKCLQLIILILTLFNIIINFTKHLVNVWCEKFATNTYILRLQITQSPSIKRYALHQDIMRRLTVSSSHRLSSLGDIKSIFSWQDPTHMRRCWCISIVICENEKNMWHIFVEIINRQCKWEIIVSRNHLLMLVLFDWKNLFLAWRKYRKGYHETMLSLN